ncbi:hypothetical protein SAICODRAFT_183187 [Saitoella complicata NRRL Y-17804]|uniref:uncharacterized protein n=1 Tax=Saitoella complicata (strain BCRC 22490 / CBS 7301 / JCM 7358 / NBRC 10748 / NRRL Y-17804) TaxID=698492 RepID=UPI000866C85A|nr:uncharacterized protein SAICODRAFT_183187 [Saitoella complicata NRRL Y-17804]ODQ55315.1 hypothetical protein SAICODRAFT_183187 [Saitoella complicata NRRL Y-17804]
MHALSRTLNISEHQYSWLREAAIALAFVFPRVWCLDPNLSRHVQLPLTAHTPLNPPILLFCYSAILLLDRTTTRMPTSDTSPLASLLAHLEKSPGRGRGKRGAAPAAVPDVLVDGVFEYLDDVETLTDADRTAAQHLFQVLGKEERGYDLEAIVVEVVIKTCLKMENAMAGWEIVLRWADLNFDNGNRKLSIDDTTLLALFPPLTAAIPIQTPRVIVHILNSLMRSSAKMKERVLRLTLRTHCPRIGSIVAVGADYMLQEACLRFVISVIPSNRAQAEKIVRCFWPNPVLADDLEQALIEERAGLHVLDWLACLNQTRGEEAPLSVEVTYVQLDGETAQPEPTQSGQWIHLSHDGICTHMFEEGRLVILDVAYDQVDEISAFNRASSTFNLKLSGATIDFVLEPVETLSFQLGISDSQGEDVGPKVLQRIELGRARFSKEKKRSKTSMPTKAIPSGIALEEAKTMEQKAVEASQRLKVVEEGVRSSPSYSSQKSLHSKEDAEKEYDSDAMSDLTELPSQTPIRDMTPAQPEPVTAPVQGAQGPKQVPRMSSQVARAFSDIWNSPKDAPQLPKKAPAAVPMVRDGDMMKPPVGKPGAKKKFEPLRPKEKAQKPEIAQGKDIFDFPEDDDAEEEPVKKPSAKKEVPAKKAVTKAKAVQKAAEDEDLYDLPPGAEAEAIKKTTRRPDQLQSKAAAKPAPKKPVATQKDVYDLPDDNGSEVGDEEAVVTTWSKSKSKTPGSRAPVKTFASSKKEAQLARRLSMEDEQEDEGSLTDYDDMPGLPKAKAKGKASLKEARKPAAATKKPTAKGKKVVDESEAEISEPVPAPKKTAMKPAKGNTRKSAPADLERVVAESRKARATKAAAHADASEAENEVEAELEEKRVLPRRGAKAVTEKKMKEQLKPTQEDGTSADTMVADEGLIVLEAAQKVTGRGIILEDESDMSMSEAEGPVKAAKKAPVKPTAANKSARKGRLVVDSSDDDSMSEDNGTPSPQPKKPVRVQAASHPSAHLIDERLFRKPNVIAWGKEGPLNSGPATAKKRGLQEEKRERDVKKSKFVEDVEEDGAPEVMEYEEAEHNMTKMSQMTAIRSNGSPVPLADAGRMMGGREDLGSTDVILGSNRTDEMFAMSNINLARDEPAFRKPLAAAAVAAAAKFKPAEAKKDAVGKKTKENNAARAWDGKEISAFHAVPQKPPTKRKAQESSFYHLLQRQGILNTSSGDQTLVGPSSSISSASSVDEDDSMDDASEVMSESEDEVEVSWRKSLPEHHKTTLALLGEINKVRSPPKGVVEVY